MRNRGSRYRDSRHGRKWDARVLEELIPHLSRDRSFAIWPFGGDLGSLLEERGVVLCETYPGLAYAAALAGDLPTGRIRNAKTNGQWRSDACGRSRRRIGFASTGSISAPSIC